MNLTQLMSDYYQLIAELQDPEEARAALVGIVNIAIFDIQEKGLILSPLELEKHIGQQIQEFLDIAKKNKVA